MSYPVESTYEYTQDVVSHFFEPIDKSLFRRVTLNAVSTIVALIFDFHRLLRGAEYAILQWSKLQ